MKKVSIIIPCYNAQGYLSETMQSAMDQTWPHKEIVAVDDGSTDGTRAILDRFRSETVKVFLQTNQGAGAAKNFALTQCTGDYIQYLDADDLLSPDKIEAQVKQLETVPGSEISFCKWSHFSRPDASDAAFPEFERYHDYGNPVDMIVAMWKDDWHLTNHAWLISRRIADAIGPWDRHVRFSKFTDDFEYFTRALCANGGVTYSPVGLAYYRKGVATALTALTISGKQIRDMFDGLEERGKTALAREDSPRVREAMACQYYRFAFAFYGKSGDTIGEARARLRALGVPPPDGVGGPIMRLLTRSFGFWPALRLFKAMARAKACFRRNP